MSTPGARLDTDCSSAVVHCFLCSRYPSVVWSSHSRSGNTIEGCRADASGTPAALPIGRWWSSLMDAARFGRREASLGKPRGLSRRSTPIGGAISIHGSARSLACPMNGYLGAHEAAGLRTAPDTPSDRFLRRRSFIDEPWATAPSLKLTKQTRVPSCVIVNRLERRSGGDRYRTVDQMQFSRRPKREVRRTQHAPSGLQRGKRSTHKACRSSLFQFHNPSG